MCGRNRTELVVSVDGHRVRIDDAVRFVGVRVLAKRLEFVRLVRCLRLPAVVVAIVHRDRLMLRPVQSGEQLLGNYDLLYVIVLMKVLQAGRREQFAVVGAVVVVGHGGGALRLAVRVLLMRVMLVLLLALRRSLADQTLGLEIRERQRGAGQVVCVVASAEIEVRIIGVRVLEVAVIRADRERAAVVQATHHAGAALGRLTCIGRILISATRVTATRKRSLQ